MSSLSRVPPAVGQGLAVVGLAACFFGVALPHLRAASGEGARAELAESEAYLEMRVAEFARVNGLSPNHSLEVTNYRYRLADDLAIPELRRAAAAHAGSDKNTPLAPIVVFVGLALLAIGCLTMVASGQRGAAVWTIFLVIALAAGGVGLHHPEARAVPSLRGGLDVDRPEPVAARPREVGVSARTLCEHVMKVVFAGQGNMKATDDMLDSCIESVNKKPPTAEQRRCIMRARTTDDLQSCNLK